jgi:ribose 1,5-bisphosphokinase PhnN
MNKRIYLITGPSGSGKTTISDHLTALGHASVDADSTQGISYFVNQNGKPVPYPADANAAWWETHHYVWELDRLKKLIDATNPTDGLVFVAGNAANINKAWDIFSAVFYLDLPVDVMTKRMAAAGRENSFGHRLEEQDQLLRWVDGFKAEMLELGTVTLDATQPVDKVAAGILDYAKQH